ncbi:MAG: hypothetical protein DI626_03010 [Micavibrio aeruginosavorus]|uniref:Uncharacterized protein n=1 Tax=Micavibrio aeruginosavorus TaxID=349221 RepID=A0A2W5A3K1_9BACT|nr:MAG: hypothetical protein DI626_03010 [Micavibrio aeruginosavorus]
MHSLQTTSDLSELAQHLKKILLGEMNRQTLREDFMERAAPVGLTPDQSRLLHEHASPTAQEEGGVYTPSMLWHAFTDPLKKRLCAIPLLPRGKHQAEAAMEMLLFARWNIANYEMFVDASYDQPAPPYPSPEWKVRTFPALLGYMRDSYLPVLGNAVAATLKVTPETLETYLGAMEKDLLATGPEGVEIFRPIPQNAWRAPAIPEPA